MAELWLPDFPPASPSAYDDEFADLSLSASWTEWDVGNKSTITEVSSGLKLLNVSTNSDAWSGIYRDVPTGDWAIWTKLGFLGLTGDYLGAGIFVAEDLDANPDTANFMVVEISWQGSPQLRFSEWYDYANYKDYAGLQNADVKLPTDYYLRIRKSGSTIYGDWSSDGIGWLNLGSRSFTPVMMGLALNNHEDSSTDMVAIFPFFRCVTGSPSLTDVMRGRRVDPENPPAPGVGMNMKALHYKRLRQ